MKVNTQGFRKAAQRHDELYAAISPMPIGDAIQFTARWLGLDTLQTIDQEAVNRLEKELVEKAIEREWRE